MFDLTQNHIKCLNLITVIFNPHTETELEIKGSNVNR